MPSSKAPSSTPADLIDDIVGRFHETHRADLARLLEDMAALAAQGVALPLQPALQALAEALEQHMFKEEMRLFPMMLQGGNRLVPHLIAELEAEHRQHHSEIDALAKALQAVCAGPDAAPVLAALRARLAKLQGELRAHIEAEDERLFPMFDGVAPRF